MLIHGQVQSPRGSWLSPLLIASAPLKRMAKAVPRPPASLTSGADALVLLAVAKLMPGTTA